MVCVHKTTKKQAALDAGELPLLGRGHSRIARHGLVMEVDQLGKTRVGRQLYIVVPTSGLSRIVPRPLILRPLLLNVAEPNVVAIDGDGSLNLPYGAQVGHSGVHVIYREAAALSCSKDELVFVFEFPKVVKGAGPVDGGFKCGLRSASIR
jgi:hypothetical protein